MGSVAKSSVRFPGKASKVATTMLYFASIGGDPKLAVQIDSLPVAFPARVTSESQNKDRCTIALALDPSSETYMKLAAIDLALVKSFLSQRDKDKDMKRMSDQQVIDDCVGGVRPPPDDKPEYSPTFRATVDVRRGPNDEYFLDSDRCKIYDINLQEMTDVQVLPKGSRLIVAATPSWIWTMGSRIGITWSCVTICVKSTPNTEHCPLLITHEMAPTTTPKHSTTAPLGDDGPAPNMLAGDDSTDQPNRHELELMFQHELEDAIDVNPQSSHTTNTNNNTATTTTTTTTPSATTTGQAKRKDPEQSATDDASEQPVKRSKS